MCCVANFISRNLEQSSPVQDPRASVCLEKHNIWGSNNQLRSDVVRGREIYSRLVGAIKNRKDDWDSLWLWQCWQARVTSHLEAPDRKSFGNLTSALAGQIGQFAYLAACLAQELEYLENLLNRS